MCSLQNLKQRKYFTFLIFEGHVHILQQYSFHSVAQLKTTIDSLPVSFFWRSLNPTCLLHCKHFIIKCPWLRWFYKWMTCCCVCWCLHINIFRCACVTLPLMLFVWFMELHSPSAWLSPSVSYQPVEINQGLLDACWGTNRAVILILNTFTQLTSCNSYSNSNPSSYGWRDIRFFLDIFVQLSQALCGAAEVTKRVAYFI